MLNNHKKKIKVSAPINTSYIKTNNLKKLSNQIEWLFKLKNIRKKIAYFSIISIFSLLILNYLFDIESTKMRLYLSRSLNTIGKLSASSLVLTYLLEEYIGSKSGLINTDKK